LRRIEVFYAPFTEAEVCFEEGEGELTVKYQADDHQSAVTISNKNHYEVDAKYILIHCKSFYLYV
jgi:uncharacterized protein YhfF